MFPEFTIFTPRSQSAPFRVKHQLFSYEAHRCCSRMFVFCKKKHLWSFESLEVSWQIFIHRENGGALGMVPLIVNPIYTLYRGYLLGIYPFKGLLGGNITHMSNPVENTVLRRRLIFGNSSESPIVLPWIFGAIRHLTWSLQDYYHER